MAYSIYYLHNNLRYKVKTMVNYNGASLYKNILAKRYPSLYFYVLEDGEAVYEIWWYFPNDRISYQSDHNEYYDYESLSLALMSEKYFWDRAYRKGDINEVIIPFYKKHYYKSQSSENINELLNC